MRWAKPSSDVDDLRTEVESPAGPVAEPTSVDVADCSTGVATVDLTRAVTDDAPRRGAADDGGVGDVVGDATRGPSPLRGWIVVVGAPLVVVDGRVGDGEVATVVDVVGEMLVVVVVSVVVVAGDVVDVELAIVVDVVVDTVVVVVGLTAWQGGAGLGGSSGLPSGRHSSCAAARESTPGAPHTTTAMAAIADKMMVTPGTGTPGRPLALTRTASPARRAIDTIPSSRRGDGG